ncbi:hypothetical protein Bealeia1_01136 [Candidatus Bealeia paramacronuclearis]|uniref:Uncharacterized protein n=1 Tax=Candidatus Bealeia paramacronuclearis TaxID=1921001 RepID=A0ABZ2C448_9PROT
MVYMRPVRRNKKEYFLAAVFCSFFSSLGPCISMPPDDQWEVEILQIKYFNVDSNLEKIKPCGLVAYPKTGKDPDYVGHTALYGSTQFKVPQFSNYFPDSHSGFPEFPSLFMQIPRSHIPNLPKRLLDEMEKDQIAPTFLTVLVSAHNHHMPLSETVVGFEPQYGTDPNAPNRGVYWKEKDVKSLLFNEGPGVVEFYKIQNAWVDGNPDFTVNNEMDNSGKIITSIVPNKTFIVHHACGSNCTHADTDETHLRVVTSPVPLGVKGLNKFTNSLYSYVSWNENGARKAIVTLHMFVQSFKELFKNSNSGTYTTEQLVKLFQESDRIPGFAEGKNPMTDLVHLITPVKLAKNEQRPEQPLLEQFPFPVDFNPEVYRKIHPGLDGDKGGIGSPNFNPLDIKDRNEYAKWQFATYGWNHGLNYLPNDFNPDLYRKIHPGLDSDEGGIGNPTFNPLGIKDRNEYAKWQFATYGWNHGLNYLPNDFNPDLYRKIHPGLDSDEGGIGNPTFNPLGIKDRNEYAKWQFATYGWNHGLNYLPNAHK